MALLHEIIERVFVHDIINRIVNFLIKRECRAACRFIADDAALHAVDRGKCSFCRIAHVSGDLFCVCQIALLCSPPFVPPVVGAMQNKKVLISGIVIGLVGYAIGTYLGVLIAFVLP